MLRYKKILALGISAFLTVGAMAQSNQLSNDTKNESSKTANEQLKQLDLLPPPAVKISDIPAYNNYFATNPLAKIVSLETTETVAIPAEEMKAIEAETPVVETRVAETPAEELPVTVVEEVAVKREVTFVAPDFEKINESRAAAEKLDLSAAKRIAVGELLPALSDVYFIQLASLTRTSGNANKFRSLTTYGNIYKVNVGGATKIKLGYFVDKYEADRILTAVRGKGYSDAFITRDRLNTTDLELVLSTYDNPGESQSYTPAASTSSSNYNANSYTSSPITYKVRLASYEDPIWFDIENAKKLGTIEQWTKGTWTIFILSEFRTYDDALRAKNNAINKGFLDAEVVADNNGVLERVK